MTTLYQRLFSYRQNEKLSPRETFLTEILGYCLEFDKQFLNDFLSKIGFSNVDEELVIKTQNSYTELGRPDIELSSNNHHIIIECKVEATERKNQLRDYAMHLMACGKKTVCLVYLTKFVEGKVSILNTAQFVQLCWYDVAKLIKANNHFYTVELKKHLNELGMAHIRYFDAWDLATLKAISSTIEKMDDTLDAVHAFYINHFGGVSKKSSRSTRLKEGWYINWQSYLKDKKIKFDITYGYYWFWDDDEIPSLGVRLWIPTYGKNYRTNEYYSIFSKELKSWIKKHQVEELESGVVIANYKHLSEFMTHADNEEQLKEIIEFLQEECFMPLVKIKKTYPPIFTGHKYEAEVEE